MKVSAKMLAVQIVVASALGFAGWLWINAMYDMIMN